MATAKKPAAPKAEQKYQVVEAFYDRHQDNRLYRVGETYLTQDMEPDWVEGLESGTNKTKKKLIKKV